MVGLALLAYSYLVQFKTTRERDEWPRTFAQVRLLTGVFAFVKWIVTQQQTVVTDVLDSPGDGHAPGTFHQAGRAVDLRSSDMNTQDKHTVLENVRPFVHLAGGRIVLEKEGEPDEHFHLQI